MTCPDCIYTECLGTKCSRFNADLVKAEKDLSQAFMDVPQLKAFLPKDSLLIAPKVEVGVGKENSGKGTNRDGFLRCAHASPVFPESPDGQFREGDESL